MTVNFFLNSSSKLDQFILKIPLRECREPLIKLGEEKVPGLVFNTKKSSGKTKIWVLRRSVAKALFSAASRFWAEGYLLSLEDSYRNPKVQGEMFLRYLSEVRKQFPALSSVKAQQKANTFIAGIPILAAHTAGAAVDVILLARNGRKVIDMGCDYLTLGSEAITDNPNLNEKQIANRRLLKSILSQNGFINYPYEYWHYSLGDACAAYLTSRKFAIYGPVDYNLKTGKTVFPSDHQKFYQFYRA
mgnify:CR=1 FL=1